MHIIMQISINKTRMNAVQGEGERVAGPMSRRTDLVGWDSRWREMSAKALGEKEAQMSEYLRARVSMARGQQRGLGR